MDSDSKGFAIVLLAAWFLGACSDDTCISHTSRVCAEGNIYWMDSCGNYEELEEECRCGCKTVAVECKRCDDCDCDEENTCCDGCLAQNDGELCDDGDPVTHLDHCQDGLCSGWRFTVAEPALPAGPAAPEPVRLRSWGCPPGWSGEAHASLLDENGQPYSWCRPPPLPRLKVGEYITPLKDGEPDGDRPVCEPEIDGTFPLLGHADCRPLGDPCPAGEWPEIPPEVTGARIYVRAGATGGDGTPAAPFGNVIDAVAAAAPGDVVVIAAGSYVGVVNIDKNLTLWGACVQQSAISAPDPGAGYNFGAVRISGPAQVTLRNLRIGGDQYGLRVVNSGANVLAQGVWISQAADQAVQVDAGTARLVEVLVDSTRAIQAGQLGMGLTVKDGADCQIRSSTFEANHYAGVRAQDSGTTLTMQDAAVRNTRANAASPDIGWGLQVKNGASAEVIHALFDHNLQTGVYITGASTGLLLQDAVIADTLCDTAGRYGDGLWVQAGARGRMVRGRLSSNHHIGAIVIGTGANLEIEDSVVFDTQVDEETGGWGVGILAEEAALSVLRTVVEGNCPVGIMAQFENASASLEDVVVRRTRYTENNLAGGEGLFAAEGASLDVTRGLIEENYEVAVYVSGAGTQATLEDVTVQDTRCAEDTGELGLGLLLDLGAQAFVSRGVFARNHSEGVRAMNPGSWLQLCDVEIRETRGRDSDGWQGMGLWITEGAGAEVSRALLEENTNSGILISEPGTSLSIEDVTVKDTQGSRADQSGGDGLFVGWGATALLSRGWFENNHMAGIYCGLAGSQLTLEDVTVIGTLGQESDGDKGYGMAVADGGRIDLQRGYFEGNHSTGIGAGRPGTRISLSDVVVKDTRSRQWDLWLGRGMEVNLGAEATVTNSRFESNHDVGIIAFGPGTRVTLNQVIIRNTLERECAGGGGPYPCEGFGHGTGLGAFDQARVELEGVEIETSQMAGLQLAIQGTATGMGLALRDNPVGINIQNTPEWYDFFEQVKGLLMENNQTNFDTTELPVPDLLDIGL